MSRLTLGEGWTPEVRERCAALCGDEFGDPPCWSLAGDDAMPSTENPMRPCVECASPEVAK